MSSTPQQLTLYRFQPSPYSHKVELALVEAKATYKVCDVDLFNKPEWFAAKVNPAGKVPAITYGGPEVSPDDPSPLSEKIAESAVILEFIADIYPDSGLLPKDPVLRAKVRFFVDTVATKLLPPFFAFSRGLESYENFLKGVEAIQDLLPETGDFAVGDTYTIADATIVPFVVRLKITYEKDLGKFAPGEGRKLGEELHGAKYAKLMRYTRTMLERPSTKATYDEEHVTSVFRKVYAQPPK
ncbi:glutathione S-transferase [Leucogyrophana mollusca]|uniref:Glutathione S-transferase n=1 Tax=Leucogyrophana mollusca TaxID=85980 RepID=A0ACB8BIG8_9AGAM|nr:glutathione S-transferase [Leucogyrophana mollusca]